MSLFLHFSEALIITDFICMKLPWGREKRFDFNKACYWSVCTKQALSLAEAYSLLNSTLRLMAGVCPTKTQQLLEKSVAVTRGKTRGLVCSRERHVYCGEREHGESLLLACKHLPHQLHSSQAETTGDVFYFCLDIMFIW